MKTINPEMREHLSRGVTTLATCWEIVRRDGKVLRYTDCDEDLVVDGKTYLSSGAYSRTAIESTNDLSVDNLDVEGITNAISLPAEELRNGLFDHAQVYVFATPWMERYAGVLKMRRGFFGEVQVQPNGTFKVEMRGLMQRFSHTYTEVFSPTCRHEFGDNRCGFPVFGDPIRVDKEYKINDTVVIYDSARTNGDRYNLEIGDHSFEDLAEFGVDNARYWFNATGVEAADYTTTDNPYTGSASARGSALAGAMIGQDVAVLDGDTVTEALIDSGDCTLNLHAFRRNGNGRGRIRFHYLDWERRRIRTGEVLDNVTVPGMGSNFIPAETYNDFTVEAWVRNFGGGLVGNADSPNRQSITFSGAGLAIYSEPDDLNPAIGNETYHTPGFGAQASGWMHLAVVRSGSVTTIYVNGGEHATLNGWSTPFRIRQLLHGHSNNEYTGYMDEFRVWDVARTGEEIRANMRTDLPNGTANLIHYYGFENVDNAGSGGGTLVFNTNNSTTPPITNVFQGSTTQFTPALDNVGPEWSEVTILNRPLPPKTRMVRIMFEGDTDDPANTQIDEMRAFVRVPNVYGSEPTALSRVIWQCTKAGIAHENLHPGITVNNPAIGDTLDTGGAIFTARKAIFRTARVTKVTDRRTFRITLDWADPEAVDGWYDGGLASFYTGNNAGAAMEIKSWTVDDGEINLFLSMPQNIEIGDTLAVYPGCDKSRICCSMLWDNIANFFGTPDVPGEDALLRYPDSRR